MSQFQTSSSTRRPISSSSIGSRASQGGETIRRAPVCYCETNAMVKTAYTDRIYGKRFWGCKYYKKKGDEKSGCNFFLWYSDAMGEDIEDVCETKEEDDDYAELSEKDQSMDVVLHNCCCIYVCDECYLHVTVMETRR